MLTAFRGLCGATGVALLLISALLISGCGYGEALEDATNTENRQASDEAQPDIATEETMYDDGDPDAEAEVDEDDADETLFDAAELAEVSKEEFIKGLDTQMKKLDRQIEDMEARSDQIRDDVQRRWETTINSLREERAELKEEYKDLKDANEDLWEDFRATVMASWNKTRVALEKAENDFERYMKQE